MTLQNINFDSLLKKAKKRERKYDWFAAAEIYKEAFSLVQEDYEKTSEIHERIGYCFLRAAFQAETNEQFRRILKQSAESYKNTFSLLQKSITEDKEAKICHVKAMVAYLNARLIPDIAKRRKLIDEVWKLENDALKLYKKTANQLAIGKTYNNLLEWLFEKQQLESSWSEIKRTMLEGIDYGEKAITTLSDARDEYELARAYGWIIRYYGLGKWFRVYDISDQTNKKILKYHKMALDLSKKTGDAYLISRVDTDATNFYAASGNIKHAIKFGKNAVKYGAISKDNQLMGGGSNWTSQSISNATLLEVDPDKQRENCKTALKFAQDSIHYLSIIDDFTERFLAYNGYVIVVKFLASIETNLETKRRLLEETVKIGRENIKAVKGETIHSSPILLTAFSKALQVLSEIETREAKKQRLLEEALYYIEKQLEAMRQLIPFDYNVYSSSYKIQASILAELAKIESGQKKIKLLDKAVSAMEKCVESIERDLKDRPERINIGGHGSSYYFFGGILEQLNSLTKNKKLLDRAIETYKISIKHFSSLDLKSRVAEAYWQIAKLENHLGHNLESAQSYQTAAQTYKLAAEKHPKLKEFYSNHSDYMQAWSEIEQAKYSHSIEEYDKAQEYYQKTSEIHAATEFWNYLAPNYIAWATLEEAEFQSRNENAQKSKEKFQKALEEFAAAETSIRQKILEVTSLDEKEMIEGLLKALDLRRKYCQARVLLENAKLLDREGKYLQSSRSFGEAAQKLGHLIEKIEIGNERKEIEYLIILCQAWEKMASAEETTSPETYLEAAQLFEQAKEYCYTKRASLWALGNSNFCKGLAAGVRYRNNMDLKENALAKQYIKGSASSYFEAGFTNASEYAKATLRLFDAYVFMNQAESEADPQKKTKQYQMAENLLQIAAGSFMKGKQPEKTAQVQRILSSVREEKALAVSLSQIMQAPTIASSTLSFTAPSPTSEASVGLEQFQHANIQANLIADLKEVKIRQSFCLTVELVNAGKEPALLTMVENFVPSDFIVVEKPEIYRLEDSCLNMKGKQIAPLKLVEAKLILQPSKKGTYQLKPIVHYLDELGQNKTLQLKPVEIKVEEVILPDRISTGTKELDSLLLGGIPKEYAVVLTDPSSDERELLVQNFLEAGTKEIQTTFYVTTETVGLEKLLENSCFHLFLCNPKPKVEVPDLPNIIKLRSKTDINNLNMALVKESRDLQTQQSPKRLCVEVVSDVLLEYGAKTTRKWLAELITELTSKNFIILAMINPAMHPSDQTNSVLDLFDGEINITQPEDPLECKKSIQVRKLRGQDYIKNAICLPT